MKKNLILGSVIVASLVQYTSPAFANKETIGNIIGGVIGGVIGSQIGKGNGNTAAIIIGTIAGTMIGGKVGQDMDEADRRAFQEAQDRALRNRLGDRCDWDGRNYGSRTGSRGSFTSTREGYNSRTGEYCREYTSVIYTRHNTEETRGIACTRRDGSWYEVRETEVRFNGGYGGGRQEPSRPPRYPEVPPRPNLPPPPPAQSRYEGTANISQITRRSGGEWIRINVNNAVSLERLEVRALSAGVKIHEAIVHTGSGDQIRVRELSPTPTFYAGDTAVSENLNLGRERVQAIDIRAESMGGNADVLVRAISNSGYPSLGVSRY
ncbi:beta-sandwich domain-containing protein [Bdellovibrio sp. HCB-110]|uniref:beta-sandwich domain-containing protein n=1 Tax=Bdellovibrio sp. HCB-110 TaxID=3391182 RepID=UPI0039B410C1